jgi:hypothetical protein
MATLTNESELKEKCEKATNYGLKESGRVYFETQEELEFACFYFDVVLCYHVTGFKDDKGIGLSFRQY